MVLFVWREKLGSTLPTMRKIFTTKTVLSPSLKLVLPRAGFRAEEATSHQATISGLAQSFREQLGESAFLHFTNLTPWHESLPKGVTEHPYVTAAGLCALENRGVQAGGVDIIYSRGRSLFRAGLHNVPSQRSPSAERGWRLNLQP